jgi:hypothetical protein
LHWKAESCSCGEDQDIFESCCKKGSVELELLPSLLPILCDLFSSNSSPAKQFHSNIQQYNAALTYTSFSYSSDPRLHPQEYTYMFQLQGAIYYLQGPLHGSNPSYS